MNSVPGNLPTIVAGVRTPFVRSHGAYADLSSFDLGRIVLSGLVAKTGIETGEIDLVTMGTVLHEPRTPNVARESVLGAGFPATIPAYTVSLACISSNVAATNIADMIQLERIKVAIFGGTDTCSDPPIRFSPKLRKLLVKISKAKGTMGYMRELKSLASFKAKDFAPDVPQVTEFSNGKSMGEGAEVLAQQLSVTREQSDLFALRSQQNALQAYENKVYENDLIHVQAPPRFRTIEKDEGPRADTTLEALTKLRPAFDKKFGVATAGSSSFLTDGASAVLMMSLAEAHQRGYTPYSILKDHVYRAGDALTEMLSGPAMTIPCLLAKNNLDYDDIGVWEIHEAFACQVVANLNLIADKDFVSSRLHLDKKWAGHIPMEKLNLWGGSLSLGHPFGATGGRLLWTASRRLQEENQRYAVVSGCAAGGHGSAILLENPNFS
ncbi:MAG: acetyl-CoA C-acyltransferase [Zetaproteobacteria bacterium]|nr:acetyl-CoA C-acyltransferase [Zetaproteobacteria bacterium]